MIPTTLSVIVYLSAIFGGPSIIGRDLEFTSPAACAKFLHTLEKSSFRYEVLRPCDPPPPVESPPIPEPAVGAPES